MAGTQSKVHGATNVKPTWILEDGSGLQFTPKSAQDFEWGPGLKYGYAHGMGSPAPYAITVENAEPSYKCTMEHDDFRAITEQAGRAWHKKSWTIQMTATAPGLDNFDVKIKGARLAGDEKSGPVIMADTGAPCLNIFINGISALTEEVES
jgi:hypothetical protein